MLNPKQLKKLTYHDHILIHFGDKDDHPDENEISLCLYKILTQYKFAYVYKPQLRRCIWYGPGSTAKRQIVKDA